MAGRGRRTFFHQPMRASASQWAVFLGVVCGNSWRLVEPVPALSTSPDRKSEEVRQCCSQSVALRADRPARELGYGEQPREFRAEFELLAELPARSRPDS